MVKSVNKNNNNRIDHIQLCLEEMVIITKKNNKNLINKTRICNQYLQNN